MLPQDDQETLKVLAAVAIAVALKGCHVVGYNLLYAGLCRAERLHQEGDPWGAERVSRYLEVLDRYTGEFGVGLE
jgi:hypothetical protein